MVSAEVDAGNMFTMRSVLQSLHRQHGVGSVMVEGGVRLIQNLILEHTQAERSGNPAAEDGELVDTVVVTVSTKAIGGKRIEGVTYNFGSNAETFRLGACVFSPHPHTCAGPSPPPAASPRAGANPPVLWGASQCRSSVAVLAPCPGPHRYCTLARDTDFSCTD